MSNISADATRLGAPATTMPPRTHLPLQPAAFLLAIGCCVTPQLARAQEAPEAPRDAQDADALSTVEVKARAEPSARGDARIDTASLARMRAATNDTASLLDRIAGGASMAAGGISGLPVLDGMADDRLNVVVDGMSIVPACANHMNPPLSYIAPTHVESIEVDRGVAPVSLGGDSIGGSIVVKSPGPRFAGPGQTSIEDGTASAYARSNGNAMGASLSANWANQALALGYSGSTARADDYTAGGNFHAAGPAFAANPSVGNQSIPWIAGDQVGSTAYRTTNQELRLAMRGAASLLDLKVGVQRTPEQLFPNQRMDMTGNDSTFIDLHYTADQAWGTLDARLYGHDVRHAMNFGPDKQFYYGSASAILAPGMPMNTHGKDLGGEIKGDIKLSAGQRLTIGAVAQDFRLDEWWPPSPAKLPPGYTSGGMAPDTFWNIDGGRRDRLGLYGELATRWNDRWESNVGLRAERVSMNTGPVQGYNAAMYNGAPLYPASTFNAADRASNDTNLDFTVLASYTPGPTTSVSAGFARKTRSPNLYERYGWSTSPMAMAMIGWAGDGNLYIGNLDLKPEVANTFSLTAHIHDSEQKAWGLDFTPYYSEVHDYIDVRRCPTTVCGSTPAVTANLGATRGFVQLQYANVDARIHGLDVNGHAALGSVASLGAFRLEGTLGYVRGENLSTGDNLNAMMPLNATVRLVQTAGGWTGTIEEQLVAAKTSVSAVRDELTTAGYALLNLRGSYTRGRVRFDVGVANVLNRFYDLPLGGAYLGQGPTMSSTGIPWGIAVPGMGRSVYAGMTLKF